MCECLSETNLRDAQTRDSSPLGFMGKQQGFAYRKTLFFCPCHFDPRHQLFHLSIAGQARPETVSSINCGAGPARNCFIYQLRAGLTLLSCGDDDVPPSYRNVDDSGAAMRGRHGSGTGLLLRFQSSPQIVSPNTRWREPTSLVPNPNTFSTSEKMRGSLRPRSFTPLGMYMFGPAKLAKMSNRSRECWRR